MVAVQDRYPERREDVIKRLELGKGKKGKEASS